MNLRFTTPTENRTGQVYSLRACSTAMAVIVLAGYFCGCKNVQTAAPKSAIAYPITAQTNQVDEYHGTIVRDPYRWLEDDNSPATKAWIDAENKITFGFLETIPERAAIKQRLTELWNYERFGTPNKAGDRYFFSHNNGLQNQSVLYTMNALNAQPSVLFDPNTLSTNGIVSLANYKASRDGNFFAYGLARAGSDWEEWHVRDVRTDKDLPDELHWVKFSSASWTKDGQGLYYSRYDEPKSGDALKGVNYFHKLYYHRLGTPQSADVLVYQRLDHKDWNLNGQVTDDGHYLVIDVSQGTDTRNQVFYQGLQNPGSPVVELLNDFDASYRFIDNVGTIFYFRTDLKASLGRVIAIDVAQPARANWREIIPQRGDRLEDVSLVHDELIATYLHDAHSDVKMFRRDGQFVRGVGLPGIGTVTGFGGKRHDTETFYTFTSYTAPATVYRYDLTTGTSTIFRQSKVAFDPRKYETKQVFYHSKDGTRVPMFITAKRGLKLDGNSPVLLYGYGGFDISVTPVFSAYSLMWLEMGGVYAVATLRGGGEYGEDWHHAGMKLKKQNVFDDFISAAEWLAANYYTRPARLAIEGRSNGGLLVGACLTQRPDLFGAVLPVVGVMDMLRFPKFTIGWAWTSEYGSPESPEEFKALYAYSPLHHVKPGQKYPATFITTGDHDDRVVPAHSFKFAAALQSAQAGNEPVLIRIETQAGHGAGKPTAKLIDESADKLSFLAHELGMNVAGIEQWQK